MHWRPDAPQHVACRALLEAAQGKRQRRFTSQAPATPYVASQILFGFYAIVTNAKRVLKPRSSADALAAISGMLAFLRVLPVPITAIDEVMALLRRRPVTGGDIFDLQIVATMKLNGILRIYTFNTDDFKPLPEIKPLTA
jgi:predicted nucleic acid-binding protein